MTAEESEPESEPESEICSPAVPERQETPYREPTPFVSSDSDDSSRDELDLINQEEAQLVSAGLGYVYENRPEFFFTCQRL